jgi:hypothetical protein
MIVNNGFDRDKINDGNTYNILQTHPIYMICKTGKIVDVNGVEPEYEIIPISENGYSEELYVTLLRKKNNNDEVIYDKLRLAKLMLNLYYGEIDLPFYFIDGDYKNCNCANLQYYVDTDTIIPFSLKSFKLANLEFKMIRKFNTSVYISENGVIYDSYTNKIKPIYLTEGGYKRINIYISSEVKRNLISRLVYMTFNDDYDISTLDVIHHKDSNIWNNHYTNLEKTTNSDNVSRSFVEEDGNQRFELKFPIDVVKEIKDKMSNGILFDQLAEEYDISHFKDIAEFSRYCTRLRTNRDFKHQLGEDYDFAKYNEAAKNKKLLLSKEDIHFICKGICENKSYRTIYQELNNTNISQQAFHDVFDRVRTKRDHLDVSSQYDLSNYDTKVNRIKHDFTDEDKKRIKKLHAERVPYREIARRFNITENYVYRICSGRV